MADKSLAEHWTKHLDRRFEQGVDTPGSVLIGHDEGELRLAERAEA